GLFTESVCFTLSGLGAVEEAPYSRMMARFLLRLMWAIGTRTKTWKSNCPTTRQRPRRRMRERAKRAMEGGASKSTSTTYVWQRALYKTQVLSPSRAINALRSPAIALGSVRYIAHGHAGHAILLAQLIEKCQDSAEKDHVFLEVGPEIMRMPPQVVHRASTCRMSHRLGDSRQA